MSEQTLYRLSEKAGALLKQRAMALTTAESCTGGWVGQAITSVAGSSGWYDRGFITYTNPSKQDMLGVSSDTLERFGAVSEQTVREMAAGALARSSAQVAIAVSGIAGPAGGTPDKPVGTVCFAWAVKGGLIRTETHRLSGPREAVRRQSVRIALEGVIALLEGTG